MSGNLVCDGVSYYQYDAWNRLVKVTGYFASPGTLSQSYQYDALGRRIFETNYSQK